MIYHIHHLISTCASALPHLSYSYLGNDINRKKKKNQNVQVMLLETMVPVSKTEHCNHWNQFTGFSLKLSTLELEAKIHSSCLWPSDGMLQMCKMLFCELHNLKARPKSTPALSRSCLQNKMQPPGALAALAYASLSEWSRP